MINLWDLPLHTSKQEIVIPGETIPAIFWNAVQQRGPGVWLRQKHHGIWRSWTWAQTAEAVSQIAGGLLSLGFAKGECASILANSVVEWVWADLAIQSSGGVSNGIYTTAAPSQVQHLCADSRTAILFVEDDEQLDKVFELRQSLPDLRKIVVFGMVGLRDLEDIDVISLEDLRALGREYLAQHPHELERRVTECKPQDLATLIYTSGATGKPKGTMHLHSGLVYTVRGYNTLMAQDDSDERMCYLPLSHATERLGSVYFSMYTGTKLNIAEDPETFAENVREISPTIFAGVPRVWEKYYSGVMVLVKEAATLQRASYAWSIGVGAEVASRVLAGTSVGGWLKLKFRLARWLSLDNVRRFIGIHRARFLVTGAASISPDLVRWYLALGIPMLEVWGMTETGGVSTAVPAARIRVGSVGPAAGFNEVKLDPSTGEILVRGRNVFAGYLNLPDLMAQALDADGWLHTGDVGQVDADGYYRITHRMKDIIMTDGGKHVAPSEIENELKISPYITDAVVIGNKRPYLTAIILIEHENVEKYAQDQSVPFSNFRSLTLAAEVRQLIQGEIDRVNKRFVQLEQIREFFLLENQLSAEDEELTPTMKLKRNLVEKKYASQIEAMYRTDS